LWTSKSAAKLAEELRGLGHELVDRSVLRLLHRAGYTMRMSRTVWNFGGGPGVM
jgi:hypothetical protein